MGDLALSCILCIAYKSFEAFCIPGQAAQSVMDKIFRACERPEIVEERLRCPALPYGLIASLKFMVAYFVSRHRKNIIYESNHELYLFRVRHSVELRKPLAEVRR